MKRIFIDPAKCDGCKNCTVACMASHSDMTPRQGSLAEIRQAVYTLDLTDLESSQKATRWSFRRLLFAISFIFATSSRRF